MDMTQKKTIKRSGPPISDALNTFKTQNKVSKKLRHEKGVKVLWSD